MINLENYYKQLKKIGAEFITGVPDTLLNDFCLVNFWPSRSHVIAANGVMQLPWLFYLMAPFNGLHAKLRNGGGINPLISLTDSAVIQFPWFVLGGVEAVVR